MRTEIDPRFTEAKHPRYYAWTFERVSTYIDKNWGRSVVGQDFLPESGRVILAANHNHWIDPFLLGIVYARAMRVWAKKELWGMKYGFAPGIALGALGAIKTNRGNVELSTMRKASDALKANGAVGVFVSGTRKKTGNEDLETRQGAAWLAVRASSEEHPCPVVPIWLGTEPLTKGNPIPVVIRPPFYPSDNMRSKSAREELTEKIHSELLLARDQIAEMST